MSKKPDTPTALISSPPEGYADWLKQLKTDIACAQHGPDGKFGQQAEAQLPQAI